MISPTFVSASRCLSAFATAVVVVVLAGCTPTPAPTPSPTAAFASEEEAFAAAEATLAAYTDATNRTDLADPDSFAAVFGWLSSEALASARKNYSQFHAAGVTRSGVSTFDTFTPIEYADETVTAFACLDVSEVKLFNADGSSAVPVDRPPRQAIEVEFVSASTDTKLVISSTVQTEDLQCG